MVPIVGREKVALSGAYCSPWNWKSTMGITESLIKVSYVSVFYGIEIKLAVDPSVGPCGSCRWTQRKDAISAGWWFSWVAHFIGAFCGDFFCSPIPNSIRMAWHLDRTIKGFYCFLAVELECEFGCHCICLKPILIE